MTFELRLLGHIFQDIEAAKPVEEEIVALFKEAVAKVEESHPGVLQVVNWLGQHLPQHSILDEVKPAPDPTTEPDNSGVTPVTPNANREQPGPAPAEPETPPDATTEPAPAPNA